jgi:hypothetical protein
MVLRRFLLAAAAAAAVAFSGTASASVMVEATVPELARKADVVARGKVMQSESRVSGDGMRISTVVTLQVSEAWKGTPGETVQIQVPGGSHGGIAQIVQGAPQFREGEDVVVFLRGAGGQVSDPAQRKAPMRVVSMAQGKMNVTVTHDGAEVAAPDLDGLELVERGTTTIKPAVEAVPLKVADLKKQVKAAAP